MCGSTADLTPAWSFGVHDTPSVWLIVLAYVIAIACCVRAWRREAVARTQASPPRRPESEGPWFWLALAALLVVLAMNRPLDLHTLITDYGRELARRGGWYEHRRRVQLAFAALVGATSLVALIAVTWRLLAAPAARRYMLSLAGLWMLALYVSLRVARFHHVDAWFGLHFGGLTIDALVEFLALGMITAGTFAGNRH